MRRAARILPPFLWAALLLFLGSQPGSSLPSGPPFSWTGFDKVEHAAFYGILGFLAARAAGKSRRSALLAALLAGALCGAIDEIHQRHVPGRSSDPWDFATDAVGAFFGGVLQRLLAARKSRSVRSPR